MDADWDGIVRRGIFIYPHVWGEGPAGTNGGEDIFRIAEGYQRQSAYIRPLAARGFTLPACAVRRFRPTTDARPRRR